MRSSAASRASASTTAASSGSRCCALAASHAIQSLRTSIASLSCAGLRSALACEASCCIHIAAAQRSSADWVRAISAFYARAAAAAAAAVVAAV
jgi:hypothetical protein